MGNLMESIGDRQILKSHGDQVEMLKIGLSGYGIGNE